MRRDEPCFELVCNNGGGTHVYGAELKEEIYHWMSQIHKVGF